MRVHVGLFAQVTEGGVSVEGANGFFAYCRWTDVVAAFGESVWITSGAEAIDKQGDVAMVGPEVAVELVAFGEGFGSADAVGERGVGTSAAMKQDDGRVGAGSCGFKEVGD